MGNSIWQQKASESAIGELVVLYKTPIITLDNALLNEQEWKKLKYMKILTLGPSKNVVTDLSSVQERQQLRKCQSKN